MSDATAAAVYARGVLIALEELSRQRARNGEVAARHPVSEVSVLEQQKNQVALAKGVTLRLAGVGALTALGVAVVTGAGSVLIVGGLVAVVASGSVNLFRLSRIERQAEEALRGAPARDDARKANWQQEFEASQVGIERQAQAVTDACTRLLRARGMSIETLSATVIAELGTKTAQQMNESGELSSLADPLQSNAPGRSAAGNLGIDGR